MKKTLDENERWYKIGCFIFPEETVNIYCGRKQLDDIKNRVRINIYALKLLRNVLLGRKSLVLWLDFKSFIDDKFKYNLQSLVDDGAILHHLSEDEETVVARELANLALRKQCWWEYCLDEWGPPDDKDNFKKQIYLERKHDLEKSLADDFKKLLIQIKPDYTLEEFNVACKMYEYNETLVQLKRISSQYLERKEEERK